MVRKRQANLERFAGSIATLVGGQKRKSRAGQKLGKPKFQLDRKKERKMKKEAKKEKRLKHILVKAGAQLPETEDPGKVENETKEGKKKKKKKSKDNYIASRDNMQSLQSKQEKIYKSAGSSKMTKEEADIANKKEDRVIKDMEKRLGFRKKKEDKTPKSIDADGLGYVLHFKDDGEKKDKQKESAESAADELFKDLNDSDDDETMMPAADDDSDLGDFGDDEDLGDFGDDEEFGDESFMSNEADRDLNEENLVAEDDEEEMCDLDAEVQSDESGSDTEYMEDEGSGVDQEEDNISVSDDIKQENDITKPSTETPAATAYIPPHLRNLDPNAVLKRKIRGYVNRVSTSNIKQILTDVELVYQDHPRGEINRAILEAVSQSLLINTIMPARLCAEHVLLVACMTANIGPEFVSPLLEDLADRLTKEMSERHGKLLNNIVSIICYLYALKVVSCNLIFDIIRTLLKSFTEPDLEVLLYIFKSVGLDIRKDDPQALKDIVQIVNETGAKIKDKSSRFTWFMETLTAVKNNNVNKIPNYDKSDITEIQKAYKAAVKQAPNNLQVTLADLLDAKTKGRWWVVGAAWTGLEDQGERKVRQVEFDSKLLALAKKNHMNTEVRRNVFCVLMSSEDYEHCFEKMMKLNVKDKQEREIIYVTVLCALKCKTFNPYYTNVIKKFCEHSKNYQITMQFSIWDRLKDLKSLNATKTRNFILLLSSLISSKTISLSVLKIVNFAEIGSEEVDFFKDLFRKILNVSEVVITEIFGRLQPLPLDNLKNGIKVFLKHFLKPELGAEEKKNLKIALKCF